MNAAIRGSECAVCKLVTETWDLSDNNKTQVCEDCANDFIDFIEVAIGAIFDAYRKVIQERFTYL